MFVYVYFCALCFSAGYGAGAGFVLHTGASWARRYGLLKSVKLSSSTLMVSTLLGGSLGSFLYAKNAGSAQVYKLHPIFQVGATPNDGKVLDYEKTVAQARRSDAQQDDLDLNKLERIRMVRRKTLMNNLQRGHGLSDSHGGRWS